MGAWVETNEEGRRDRQRGNVVRLGVAAFVCFAGREPKMCVPVLREVSRLGIYRVFVCWIRYVHGLYDVSGPAVFSLSPMCVRARTRSHVLAKDAFVEEANFFSIERHSALLANSLAFVLFDSSGTSRHTCLDTDINLNLNFLAVSVKIRYHHGQAEEKAPAFRW